jgi:hypothetical protein
LPFFPSFFSFFFSDAVAVALAGVVPFLAALVEALAAAFGEPLLAAGRQGPLFGHHLGVGDGCGEGLLGDVFCPPRRLVALRLNR